MAAKLQKQSHTVEQLSLVRVSFDDDASDWLSADFRGKNLKTCYSNVFLCIDSASEGLINKQTGQRCNHVQHANTVCVHTSEIPNDDNAKWFQFFVTFHFYWWQCVWFFLVYRSHTHTLKYHVMAKRTVQSWLFTMKKKQSGLPIKLHARKYVVLHAFVSIKCRRFWCRFRFVCMECILWVRFFQRNFTMKLWKSKRCT